jgi:hypothetical protein
MSAPGMTCHNCTVGGKVKLGHLKFMMNSPYYIKLKMGKKPQSMKVCSLHFREDDYEPSMQQ